VDLAAYLARRPAWSLLRNAGGGVGTWLAYGSLAHFLKSGFTGYPGAVKVSAVSAMR
jgi:hypothetical protein